MATLIMLRKMPVTYKYPCYHWGICLDLALLCQALWYQPFSSIYTVLQKKTWPRFWW